MTQRDRIVLLVVAVLAVTAGGWFGLVSPKRDEAGKLQDDIAAKQAELTTAQGQLAQAKAARDGYRKDYASVVRLGKAVPVGDDVPSLVYSLETTADDLGIDFSSVKVTAPAATPAANNAAAVQAASGKPADQQALDTTTSTNARDQQAAADAAAATAFTQLPFTLTFDGTYFDMQRLIARLQRYTTTRGTDLKVRGRLLRIENVALGAGAEGFPKVKATLTATAFFAPSQPTLGAATPTDPAATTGGGIPVGGGGQASTPAPATATTPTP